MRKIMLAAALVLAAFVATSAQAQVHPQLIADKDVFKLEDEATERWKSALPRLQKQKDDVAQAWRRLYMRLKAARGKWADTDERTPIGVKKDEMWRWCDDFDFRTLRPLGESLAESFGRLEVRAKLCEETPLPTPLPIKPEQARK